MKRIYWIIITCCVSLALYAVPAKRGWQTYTQADGTTIEVQLLGDEFYHYTINREGQEVRLNDAGNYEVVGAEPTPERVKARRMERQHRRLYLHDGHDAHQRRRHAHAL